MKLTMLFLLLSFSAICQLNCSIKLTDSYSKKEIKIDKSFKIRNGIFQIDTLNNSIILTKLRGKHLIIESNFYCPLDVKFDKKASKNSITNLNLKPNDYLIEVKYNEIWNRNNIQNDTLFFNDSKELQNQILTYLQYLELIAKKCDIGMCSYDNLHVYRIYFKQDNLTFEIDKIRKVDPLQSDCLELNDNMKLFTTIFPKFKIQNVKQDFSIDIKLMVT